MQDLTLKNYRGFRDFTLSDLGSVNLLVGKNNSGKTAILEAIHFFASGGNPDVLSSAINRRTEHLPSSGDEPFLLDVSHVFYGHKISPGISFAVESNSESRSIVVRAVPLDGVEVEQGLFEFPVDESSTMRYRPVFALKVDTSWDMQSTHQAFLLSEDGALLVDPRRRSRYWRADDTREGPPIVFITPNSMTPSSLGGMWNNVLREKKEEYVRRSMSILSDEIEDIVFQASEFSPRYASARTGVLVGMRGVQRRIPLGSFGDGMRRLLALAVSLIHAKNGVLIIDELDTGFHYTVMPDVWKLILATARDLSVQVFATTHSFDCLKGLVKASRESGDYAVAVHKIVPELSHSVRFGGHEVVDALYHDVEMR